MPQGCGLSSVCLGLVDKDVVGGVERRACISICSLSSTDPGPSIKRHDCLCQMSVIGIPRRLSRLTRRATCPSTGSVEGQLEDEEPAPASVGATKKDS